MNPRYRRLLIPGLLVLLLVVVLVSSLAHRAEGAAAAREVVSRMTDPRIVESSGLALSRAHAGLAYTINDSGNEPLIFAIELATGSTVGTTRVAGGALVDTEALAIDGEGTLWIADTGDNRGQRTDAALYALPEQGPGEHTVRARRYPISYGSESPNVEALLVHPVTGAKLLVSKALFTGAVYELPTTLKTSGTNVAVALPSSAPSTVTDATFTQDGKRAVLRSYTSLFLVDPADWSVLATVSTPDQQQGETITAEERTLLIGSEGAASEIIRVPVPEVASTARPTPSVTPAAADQPSDETFAPMIYVAVAVVVAGVVGAGVARRVKRSR